MYKKRRQLSLRFFVYNNIYFLKIKYTAKIRKKKPMRWFIFKVSFLKKLTEKTVKTTNVITSWITLSCQRLKGPPFSVNPIRLAGTWKQYSNKAMPQLIKIMASKPRFCPQLICLNFKCPYHANVIKVFDITKSPMVKRAFFILNILPQRNVKFLKRKCPHSVANILLMEFFVGLVFKIKLWFAQFFAVSCQFLSVKWFLHFWVHRFFDLI